jgi:hypothetical protein
MINASNNGCDQAISNNATAVITPDLAVTTQPTNITECVGGTNTMTVAVSGGTGHYLISGSKVQLVELEPGAMQRVQVQPQLFIHRLARHPEQLSTEY